MFEPHGGQAAQFNKRLILEHACRVKPALALKSKELVCGVAGDDGEPVVLVRQDLPDDLVCGFEGAPDASARYRALNNLDGVKKLDEANSKLPMGGY